jgi:hypothetical protein
MIVTLVDDDGFDHIYIDGSIHNHDFFMIDHGRIGMSDGTLIEYNKKWQFRIRVVKKGKAFVNLIQKDVKVPPVVVLDEDSVDWIVAGETDCH